MSSADRQILGRLVNSGAATTLSWAAGEITALHPAPAPTITPLPWLGAGLTDLQINGFSGLDLNAPPLAADLVARLTKRLWQEGVTSYLPTIITNTDQAITTSLEAIVAARTTDPLLAATIPGIHLEGPYISPEDGPRGAHPRHAVCPPDWAQFSRWQTAAAGLIRLVTLSPEWPEAPEFIARCVASGVLVAIGHTAATTAQIDQAVAAGASIVTHFGNGAHPVLPRHPNYLWAQLANDHLALTLIGDGHHLPDTVLRVAMRMKGEKSLLVSDTVALAGMPPGTYNSPIGDQVVATPEGRLQLLADSRILAGSICPLREAIAGLTQRGLTTLADAWKMAAERPAQFLGLPTAAGLSVGAPADIVVFTRNNNILRISQTYKAGQLVYSAK